MLKFSTDSVLSINADAVIVDNIADINTNMLNEKIGATLPAVEDVSLTLAYKDGQLYAKTDIVDKMKEKAPNNETVGMLSFFVTSDTWFSADFDALCSQFGFSPDTKNAVKGVLLGSEKFDLGSLCNAISLTGIDSVTKAEAIDIAFKVSGRMFDNSITINDKGNGNYEMSFVFPKTNIAENKEGYMSELELAAFKEIFSEFTCAVDSKTTLTNNVVSTSKGSYSFSADGPEVTCKFNATTEFTPDTAKEITAPESAIDIVNILKFLG